MLIIVTLIHAVTIVAYTRLHAFTRQFMPMAVIILIGAINIADIAAAEDVTIAFDKFIGCTYFTTMDVHFRLSEHVAVGVQLSAFTQVIVATATAEDIAVNIAVEHFNMGATRPVDTLQRTLGVVNASKHNLSTSYSCNLAATEEGIAHMTAIHRHIGEIHTTVIHIASTKDTAGIIKSLVRLEMS